MLAIIMLMGYILTDCELAQLGHFQNRHQFAWYPSQIQMYNNF